MDAFQSDAFYELAHANEVAEHERTRQKLKLAEIENQDLTDLLMAARLELTMAQAETGKIKASLNTALGALNKNYRKRAALYDRARELEGALRRIIPLAERGCEKRIEDDLVWEVKRIVERGTHPVQ